MTHAADSGAEQYVWDRLHEGLTGREVVELMSDYGWVPSQAQEVVERMTGSLLPQPPAPPRRPVDGPAESPSAPLVVWPADVLPERAPRARELQVMTLAEAPAEPHETSGQVKAPIGLPSMPATPPEELSVAAELIAKSSPVRARIEALVSKARERWADWANQAAEHEGTYDALRAEAIRQGWHLPPEARSGNPWAAPVGLMMAGLCAAIGAGGGLMLLGYILTPAWWALAGVGGVCCGSLLWLLIRVTRRKRGGALDTREVINYARRLKALWLAMNGGFAREVCRGRREVEGEARALQLRLRAGARALRRKAAEAPIVIDAPADVRAELNGLIERGGRLETLLHDAMLIGDIDRVTKLPRQSPARHWRLELEDGLGRKMRYPVGTLSTARDHLGQQIAGLEADCERLGRKLEASAASASGAPQTPPAEETDYDDLRREVQRVMATLERHGRECVQTVAGLHNPVVRLREQFNETARERGCAMRA